MKLTDREWKEFKCEELFNITGSKTTPKDKLKEYGTGIYPYITTQTTQNGQAGYYNKYTDKGNILVVDSAVVGFCTYQSNDFTASDHVEKLIPKFKMNKNIGLFFTLIINNNNKFKFSYGYKASQERLKKNKIMLPVDEQGKPDYKFMEDYIKEKENNMISKYVTYLENRKPLGGVTLSLPFDWKEFNIKDIFDFIDRGKRLKKKDHIAGNIPYVSSTMFNNGVDGFIGNENGKVFTNCLSIANSGSVGYCFYHQYKYIASDHVTGLKNTKYNKWIYLYLSTIVSRISSKYSFNREINDFRIKKEKIMLPIKEDGNIDFEYMENYSKNIIKEKIEQYLTYKQIAYLKN